MRRNAYQISHLISSFTAQMMREVYQAFDGDLVGFMVLAEISARNVDQFFRQAGPDAPEQWLDHSQTRQQLLRPSNVFSIAEATGIPRETVRRKVEQLIEAGWLERDTRRGLVVKKTMAAERILQANVRQADDILALAERIRVLSREVGDTSD